MRLGGKVATVTGGGGSMGRGIALRLAREGATVVVADLNLEAAKATAAEVEATNRVGIALAVDVSNPASVEEMARAVMNRFGAFHVLVNAFGVNHPAAPVVEMAESDWQRVLEINLTGVFRCCQVVGALMREQKQGKLVNIASINGEVPPPFLAAYNVSKAGVLALTQTLAYELAPFNVQVNAINPGPVDTPLLRRAWTTRAERMGISVESFYQRVQTQIPARRMTTVEDVAAGVAFLAGPDSDGVVGIALDVAGGLLTVPTLA